MECSAEERDERSIGCSSCSISIFALILGFTSGFIGAPLGAGLAISNIPNLIYDLAILIPGIAVAVRRMHNIGRSGWWIILPFVNLVFLCLDSQPGGNEYGPNPKAA
jgi:uncharacterized membrane protein YhaH (DUF805 family)